MRTRNFIGYGICVQGTIMHYGLVYWIPYFIKDTGVKGVIKKAVFAQVIFSVMFISSFYMFMGVASGKGISGAVDEMKIKFWPTLKGHYKFWPFVQLINFSVCPPNVQVPFISTSSLIWNIYLSYMKNISQTEMLLEKEAK